MKLASAFILLIFSSLLCKAQSELLAFDERGKFIYYELVEAKGTIKTQLKERINSFFKNSNSGLKLNSVQGDTVFIASGKFFINKTVLVMSHPSGEILYHFQAEVKGEKYRFWLTDFTFIPYQRDRYGNFVPTITKGIPLESDPGKLNSGQWKEYQIQTSKNSLQFANVFKDFMNGKVPATPPIKEKAIVKKDW